MVRCNSIRHFCAVRMALYDDSLETLVASAKRHNSPRKVDFIRERDPVSPGFLFPVSYGNLSIDSRKYLHSLSIFKFILFTHHKALIRERNEECY